MEALVAFTTLTDRLQALHEALLAVRTTIVEDKPLYGDVVLVDLLTNTIDDLVGWLDEALATVREGLALEETVIDYQRWRRSMATCHTCLNLLSGRALSELTHQSRLAELTRLGDERGGDWLAWAQSISAGIDACQTPLAEANQALVQGWLTITEGTGISALSIHASNTGQYVVLAPERLPSRRPRR